MPKAKIELIIFDCDGVLVDSESVASRIFSEYLHSLGIHLTQEEVTQQFVGRSLSSCKALLQAGGRTLPDTFADDVRERTLAALSHDLDPISGIHTVLDGISLPVCVASSGRPVKINQSLRVTNLVPYFGGNIFSADQVDNPKPAPDLFLHAAKTMGASPNNAMVIEDSHVGVQAGLAAGMRVVGFSGGGHTGADHGAQLSELGAHHILDDMHDLPNLIHSYNGS